MGMRELLHTIVNYLPWREESELLAAREQIDEEYPPPSGEQESTEEPTSNGTSAGVKDANGGEWNSGV